MQDAFIVSALRTPIGRKKGTLSNMHPADLGAPKSAGCIFDKVPFFLPIGVLSALTMNASCIPYPPKKYIKHQVLH